VQGSVDGDGVEVGGYGVVVQGLPANFRPAGGRDGVEDVAHRDRIDVAAQAIIAIDDAKAVMVRGGSRGHDSADHYGEHDRECRGPPRHER
jgi:hypothetical protein